MVINPDLIHSVQPGPRGGWLVVQQGRPVDDTVHPTREEACERARYANMVEECRYLALTRVAQVVDGLCRQQRIRKPDAERLVDFALGSIRAGDERDLSVLSAGRVGAGNAR